MIFVAPGFPEPLLRGSSRRKILQTRMAEAIEPIRYAIAIKIIGMKLVHELYFFILVFDYKIQLLTQCLSSL